MEIFGVATLFGQTAELASNRNDLAVQLEFSNADAIEASAPTYSEIIGQCFDHYKRDFHFIHCLEVSFSIALDLEVNNSNNGPQVSMFVSEKGMDRCLPGSRRFEIGVSKHLNNIATFDVPLALSSKLEKHKFEFYQADEAQTLTERAVASLELQKVQIYNQMKNFLRRFEQENPYHPCSVMELERESKRLFDLNNGNHGRLYDKYIQTFDTNSSLSPQISANEKKVFLRLN